MDPEKTEPNEVRKIPKKVIKRSLKKKPLIAGGIIIVIAIAGIIGGIVLLGEIDETRGGTLVLGVTGNPTSLDPIEWGGGSTGTIILFQVTEGLFEIEYTNNGSRLNMNLATGYDWSDNSTELTCYLRENVEFHDGKPFNATAVKWNIDRLHRLIPPAYAYIWQLPDGNWIINETKVFDEYTVKFVLNQPFVPFLSLLATMYSYMLSPSSTPDNEINGIIPGTLYGTGAFIYSAYEEDNSVTLSPNLDYWGGRPAFDKVTISIFSNDTDRYKAMLSGELSVTDAGKWSDEDRDLLMNTTGIEVEVTALPVMTYIFMNNHLINTTMRKAISYAFNYSAYANLDLLIGRRLSPRLPKIRSQSPIPKEMLYSHWGSFDMPYYNISIARQALKDANWPGTAGLTANESINPGNEWELKANSSTPLATYNYTFPIFIDADMYHLLNENLKQIGVKLNQTPDVGFYELGAMTEESDNFTRDMLGIVRGLAWGADYNDPVTMINSLFSSKADGYYNVGQVNDSLVQLWMEEALEETNETVREQLYFKIEERLIEEVYPVIWVEMGFAVDTYVSNLRWQKNEEVLLWLFKYMYFD